MLAWRHGKARAARKMYSWRKFVNPAFFWYQNQREKFSMIFFLCFYIGRNMALNCTGLKNANFSFKRLFSDAEHWVELKNFGHNKPSVRILCFLFLWFRFTLTKIWSLVVGISCQMFVQIGWSSWFLNFQEWCLTTRRFINASVLINSWKQKGNYRKS